MEHQPLATNELISILPKVGGMQEIVTNPVVAQSSLCSSELGKGPVNNTGNKFYIIPTADELYRKFDKTNLKDLRSYAKLLKLPSASLKADLIKKIIFHLQANLGSRLFIMPALGCIDDPKSKIEREIIPECIVQSTLLFELTSKSQCICNGINESQPVLRCVKCGSVQHKTCVGRNANMEPYECTLCLISKLDPLIPVVSKTTLIGPLVVPITYNTKNLPAQVYESIFNITAKQLDVNNGRGIFIRCIRLDGKSNEHVWPMLGYILINGTLIETFHLGKEVMAKRKDFPKLLNKQDLVEGPNRILFVRLSSQPKMTGHKVIKLNEDLQHTYVFSIVETESISPKSLIYKVNTQNRPTIGESRERFMRQLKGQLSVLVNDDCICEDSNIDIPCSDPYLPNVAMNIPVYNKSCKHLQSFDLERFVKMNANAKLWKCPHCNEKALELTVDTHLEQLLIAIKSLNLSLPKIKTDCDGNFVINDSYKIKYKEGRFISDEDESKENFLVKITLPKEIKKPEVTVNNPNRIESPQNPEFMMGDDQQLQFIPLSQLAFYSGMPTLTFDQVTKRPRMNACAGPSQLVSIPQVITPSYVATENAEQPKFIEREQNVSQEQGKPKPREQETVGKFLIGQVSFNNQMVKRAKEGQQKNADKYQKELKELHTIYKNQYNATAKKKAVNYPELPRDVKKLGKRLKKWNTLNEYYSAMMDLASNHPIKEYSSGNKKNIENAILHQRESEARIHLAIKEATKQETTKKEEVKQAEVKHSASVIPLITNSANYVPMSTPPVNPYPFFEYCLPPDSGIPAYRLGTQPMFINPQQLAYKQPYIVPGELFRHPQTDKLVYASCIYLPTNSQGSGN